MLIRLNVDQVRVVGLWGFGAVTGLGQDGVGPTWRQTYMGQADMGADMTTQSRKFENKSNKMRI